MNHPTPDRLPNQVPDQLPDQPECWPALPLLSWEKTRDTLHMWTQIVGKIRLELTPLVNQWWNVPLYVSARGLTTSRIPYHERAFEIYFDFIAHELVLETTDGQIKKLKLGPRTVADFYAELMELLRSTGIEVKIWPVPVEISKPIRFTEDTVHASYDRTAVEKSWRILLSADAVLQKFRSRFIGKCSPVHFFWGSFDLAVTRFSGRRAPERPGADAVTREAYSHEVSSAGFWFGSPAGSGDVNNPAFYSYASPAPEGFKEAPVQPAAAHYDQQLGEFILMYDDVRQAKTPSSSLLAFCQSTYEAAANNANWDRKTLER
jgi:hypothetical protein